MRIEFRGILLPIVLLVTANSQSPKQNSEDVCTLLESAKKYEGKKVMVTGTVRADLHTTLIQGTACSGAMVLYYDRKTSPKGFVDAIEDRRFLLDKKPLKVTVEGIFRSCIKAPLGYVSRIEVTSVVRWEIESQQK